MGHPAARQFASLIAQHVEAADDLPRPSADIGLVSNSGSGCRLGPSGSTTFASERQPRPASPLCVVRNASMG